ncbi:AAA family ATPase [Sporosarcina ureae]|uniref:AAA family ATPase n=1 Tax=Sporosarcina ureae TaxID=1571 RepID=UPI0026F0AAA2|nr:AAA family ATPase [Sporosarcina ureae]
MNQTTQREKFKSWMEKQISNNNTPYKKATVSAYTSAIAQAPNKLTGLEVDLPNIYEITDSILFEETKEIIKSAANYKEVNIAAGNQSFHHGMEKYSEFLKEQETGYYKSPVSNTTTTMKENDIPNYNQKPNSPFNSVGENIILYGPPGTGKTYSTTAYAVAIVEGKTYEDILNEIEIKSYMEVRARFENYRDNGQIDFITFHQSYGYEEFIEGIKPVMQEDATIGNSESISYEIKTGVFQDFCNRASAPIIQEHNKLGIRKSPSIWKVSLNGSKYKNLKSDCFTENQIRIGWDGYGELPDDNTNYSEYGGKKVIAQFINEMKIGDLVLVLQDERTIDAIGVIKSEYRWLENKSEYKRSRNVKWLLKNIQEDIYEINENTVLTQMSVYKLHRIKLEDVLHIIEKHKNSSVDVIQPNKKNYVFIIDEINRGNISKIFGELITLIETSKRIGQTEAITLQLPYSKNEFGVPSNVTILATMNTADRSIARLDTALRRRFRFIELLPSPDLLDSIIVEEINIKSMLMKINLRIEAVYDREHTIGHAYFMPLKSEPTMEKLSTIFKNSIIPLLQEYFYEDYQMIQLILGDYGKTSDIQFIKEKPISKIELFGATLPIDLEEKTIYQINEAAFITPAAYKKIYE